MAEDCFCFDPLLTSFVCRYGSAMGSWAGAWDLSKLVSAPQSALGQLGFSVRAHMC